MAYTVLTAAGRLPGRGVWPTTTTAIRGDSNDLPIVAVGAVGGILLLLAARAGGRDWPPPPAAAGENGDCPGPFQPTWGSLGVSLPGVVPRRQARHLAVWDRSRFPSRRLVRRGSTGARPRSQVSSQHYGSSKVGYKDIIRLWKAEHWDPDHLMALYKKGRGEYSASLPSTTTTSTAGTRSTTAGTRSTWAEARHQRPSGSRRPEMRAAIRRNRAPGASWSWYSVASNGQRRTAQGRAL